MNDVNTNQIALANSFVKKSYQALGWQQKKFAKELEVHKNTIMRWNKGEYYVPLNKVKQIKNILRLHRIPVSSVFSQED